MSKSVEPITRTRTRTATRQQLLEAMSKAELTRDEELVLRMRFGISEPTSAPLEFRGQDSPEMATRLAMLEAEALREVRAMNAIEPQGVALKSAIIDKLRGL